MNYYYVLKITKELFESLPELEHPELYDLKTVTKELPNGDVKLTAGYVPKPLDQVNLECDGC